MSELRQGWLVARRELLERSRSGAFRASVVIMVLAVVAVIVLPAALGGSATRDVGLTGGVPAELPRALQVQGEAAGLPIRIHRYDTRETGEDAVRSRDVDVLVVDARELEWPRRVDNQLRTDVATVLQRLAVQERAAQTGLSPTELTALLAPVPITDVELGVATGRGPGDELAALAMTGVLLFAIATFGSLVLSGVVEEKANRVVEVLLTRIPARTLLAGKIAGIGLLGLAQIALTGIAALVAVAAVGTDLPSVRPAVMAWALAWFVLGYGLYATTFGVLGSLASRVEDAQSVAGPVSVVLVLGYFVSFAALGSPDTTWAMLVSLFPPTAPLAMPGRIALGVTAWWEPLLAVALTVATIAVLVRVGGRVYVSALLHGGAPLSLRAAWRRSGTPSVVPERSTAMTRTDLSAHRLLVTFLVVVGVAAGTLVALLTGDVIVGVIVGASFIALSSQLVKLWSGHSGQNVRHP
jgi:ABC-2 type transport system permease protein